MEAIDAACNRRANNRVNGSKIKKKKSDIVLQIF